MGVEHLEAAFLRYYRSNLYLYRSLKIRNWNNMSQSALVLSVESLETSVDEVESSL